MKPPWVGLVPVDARSDLGARMLEEVLEPDVLLEKNHPHEGSPAERCDELIGVVV